MELFSTVGYINGHGEFCAGDQLVFIPTARGLPDKLVCATRYVEGGFGMQRENEICILNDCPADQAR